MKKYLPLILLGAGLLVLLVAFLVLKLGKQTASEEIEETVREIVLSDRPVASLTPTADGHWLNMKIEKVKVEADTMDYELLYTLPDGRSQGVPGTIKLTGETSIERKLLLGSESSGKFRYDEGVKEGTFTLRFRNASGKLITKFSTKFNLLSATNKLSSSDGKFSVSLTKIPANTFFVVMETFGVPGAVPDGAKSGPYGVFSSTEGLTGIVSLGSEKVLRWTGTAWSAVLTGSSPATGIFIGTE